MEDPNKITPIMNRAIAEERREKSETQKIVETARKLCTDARVQADWYAAWGRVCDRLTPIYTARRPVMKSFEVHHSNEIARAAFLKAAVAGQPLKECEEVAFIEAMGLTPYVNVCTHTDS